MYYSYTRVDIMMCFKQYLSVFIVLSFLSTELFAQNTFSGIPLTHHFSAVEYEAGIQNWAIAQDSRGIMYFANNFGLLEFDGSKWRLYRIENSTKLRTVVIGSDGRIYTGGQRSLGYFFPNAHGELEYTSLLSQLPSDQQSIDEIWQIYETPNGVYFCSFSKLFVLKDGKISVVNPQQQLGFVLYAKQQMYAATSKEGLVKVQNGELLTLNQSESFAGTAIRAVIPHSKSDLLFMTHAKGTLLYDGFRVKSWNESIDRFMQESLVNCAIRLRNGQIVIGTQNNGLLICKQDGTPIKHLTKGRGLQNRTVLSLFQDMLGNLWVGLNNGIAYVELNSPFSLLNEQMGVPGVGYAAYNDNGSLYLGTTNGLFKSKHNYYGLDAFELVENTAGQVYHVSKVDGELLVGHHQGAFQIDRKNNRAIKIGNEQVQGGWKFMKMRRFPNKMIGGTYNGLIVCEKQPKMKNWYFRKKLSELNESARVLEEGADGELWMTHGYKGAYRIRFDSTLSHIQAVDFYNSAQGFPSDILINVFRVQNRLIFPAQTGVYQFNRERNNFIRDQSFDDYFDPTEHLREVEEGPLGNIYFITDNYLGVLRKQQQAYIKEVGVFNKVWDLVSDDLESITALSPENVLIGAKEGFIHYNPNYDKKQLDQFFVLMRKIESLYNGDSVLFGGAFLDKNQLTNTQPQAAHLGLPYQKNGIRFTYSSPYYDGFNRMNYRVRLIGFDEHWSEWSEKTEKEYSNLPEGDYTFSVQAQNVYGELSEVMTFKFTVFPPWYRTTWAYVLYAIGVIGLLGSGTFFLDRKYRKEKAIMAEQQAQELMAKDSELEEVAKQSERAITELKNEKLKSEIKHKNKELATAAMNLLNKNEFMNAVKHHLQGLKKKHSSKVLTKEIEKIISDINKNISNDSAWKQFEFHFDQVHGDFTQRIQQEYPNLTAQDIKLCTYLRMNLSTKEIANLLNISVRGVEIARYRLRKKLALERADNLAQFIMSF